MRSVVERTARLVAIVALAWSAWAIAHRTSVETNARRALADWTTQSVRITLDSTPSPVVRDWLAALRRNGVRVAWSWRRTPPTPLAVAGAPLADPAGATRVAVAAPSGTLVALADRLGPIDTGRAASGGLTVVAPIALKSIGASGARAVIADSLLLRPLFVVGTVSWETKFVVRSLEERGWTVDTRLVLGPHHAVTQGRESPLDTAHYAAVLAIDSGARNAAASIERYAMQGGGVIVAGSARRVLGRIARASNVVQFGDDTTWRLRMDSAHGPAAHRDLWAGLVAAVAYAPRAQAVAHVEDDPAPVASTIARLGPPTPVERGGIGWPDPWVWFGVLALGLLVDWTSRRLRGAP
jgi:hypothetical protein